MASDCKAPFLRIPWTASLISRPNQIFRVPGSRILKASGEDSLFATTLKTQDTLQSCICAYKTPKLSDPQVDEVTAYITLGNGMDGHPSILHGGIVATLLDEVMGMLQTVNHERDHLRSVGKGLADGELPEHGLGSFTAYLNIKYLKPVRTSAAVVAVARYTKRAGRKDFITAEIRQSEGVGEDELGEVMTCASAEALFVVPKASKL